MSLKISVKQETKQNSELPRNRQPAFKGAGIISGMMEQVHSNFAVGFISQDMLGMAFPRIGAGLNRNRDKTGEYNWKFATQEAIREFITGPSAITIPLAILYGARKFIGEANAVPCEFIQGMGGKFAEYAKELTPEQLADADGVKLGFYTDAFKNILASSTGETNVHDMAKGYAEQLIAAEKAPKKRLWHKIGIGTKPAEKCSQQELLKTLADNFVNFKRKHAKPTDGVTGAVFETVEDVLDEHGKPTGKKVQIGTSFKKFVEHLQDYTADVTSTVKNKFSQSGKSLEGFLTSFNKKRVGTRFLTNMSMLVATVTFFMYIPKLYKCKDGNPGLAGLETDKVQVSGKEGV